MMTHEEIKNGLIQLDFNTGWVLSGTEIVSWTNSEPQPTEQELKEAAGLWAKTQTDMQAKAATDKAALLAKLGITADEAKLLLG